MKRKIIKTADGSTTIHLEDWDEQYHSKHGAVQEAYHVFINNGLHHYAKENNTNKVTILEVGFGTGLNAFITFLEAEEKKLFVHYTGVEGYPVPDEEVVQLNYVDMLDAASFRQEFERMHEVTWETEHHISERFTLFKRKQFFDEIEDEHCFDLVYFDAFGARGTAPSYGRRLSSRKCTGL